MSTFWSTGVRAGPSTKASRPVPAALIGTFGRRVTAGDIHRTQSFRNEPPDQVLPAGRWSVRMEPSGVIVVRDPNGGGGDEAFTASPDGTLTLEGPVNWLVAPADYGSFCGIEPTGTYQWRIGAGRLTLAPRHDRCADRNALFTGTWKRKG